MFLPEPIGLFALRTIGWSEWDPIGLNGSEGGWRFSDAANEYDRYMVRVAQGLRQGEPQESMIDYLIGIETHHMGLALTSNTRVRASATIAAVNQHLATLSH